MDNVRLMEEKNRAKQSRNSYTNTSLCFGFPLAREVLFACEIEILQTEKNVNFIKIWLTMTGAEKRYNRPECVTTKKNKRVYGKNDPGALTSLLYSSTYRFKRFQAGQSNPVLSDNRSCTGRWIRWKMDDNLPFNCDGRSVR